MSISMTTPLIVFGEDWGKHPSSTQHLIAGLPGPRKIIWANSIGLRRPRLADMPRMWQKLQGMIQAPQTSQNAVGQAGAVTASNRPDAIIQPRAIPWPGNPVASHINRHLLPASLRPALAAHQAMECQPILWTSLPSAIDAVDGLDPKAVIYYAGDDFSGLAGVDHKGVTRQEEKLAERADLVLAASPEIAAKFPAGKTRLLPHGCHIRQFSSPCAPADDLPSGKVLGFYGSLDSWLDTDLLMAVADSLADWTILLIGNKSDAPGLDRLLARRNVVWLGRRPHEQLPRYVQHWTASILPFRDTRQIRACEPLKLREYLAAGRPVLASDFPAARRFPDSVRIYRNPLHLIRHLVDIERNCKKPAAPATAWLLDNDWAARTRQVGIYLDMLDQGLRPGDAAWQDSFAQQKEG